MPHSPLLCKKCQSSQYVKAGRIRGHPRRSKVTSRSVNMVHNTIKLYERYRKPENRQKTTEALLSFFG